MSELASSLTHLESIRSNQRFTTSSADYNGKKVFVKEVHDPELAKALQAEVWGIETFTQLAQVKEFPFNVPEVILQGENFLVTSWVGGELMQLDPQANNFYDDIEFLSASYAALDNTTALARPMKTAWTRDDSGRTVLDGLVERVAPLDYKHFFDEELLESSVAYIDQHLPGLEARLTHADFTPNNVLVENGKKTLIDFESVNLLWPRFYDVVNMTINRLILEPELSSGMRKLFESFSQKTALDTDAHLHQLNTIAMVRLLSLIIECLSQPDTLHNTEYSMTPEIAHRIEQTIRQIISGKLYILI